MLSNKYMKDFIKVNNLKEEQSHFNRMLEREKELGIDLISWDRTHLGDFLKSLDAVSVQNIAKHLTIIKRFAEFICEKENIKKINFDIPYGELYEYINIDKLLSLTISYPQYMAIKNQLTIDYNDRELNTRDKLIFELAWAGLSNEEIKLLREDAIEFVKNDYDEEIAILNLNTDRVVRIEDSEIVNDIKKCLIEDFYIVKTKTDSISPDIIKKMSYRESEYLIKPINVGRTKKESYIDNPGITLKNVFINNVICEGIDMENMSLDDIRRSKIVYLLSPENRAFFDDETVAGLFNFKSKHGITWLKKISEIKYGKINN